MDVAQANKLLAEVILEGGVPYEDRRIQDLAQFVAERLNLGRYRKLVNGFDDDDVKSETFCVVLEVLRRALGFKEFFLDRQIDMAIKHRFTKINRALINSERAFTSVRIPDGSVIDNRIHSEVEFRDILEFVRRVGGDEIANALELRYTSDLKPSEAAEALGVSKRTYFRQVKRAVDMIREELNRRC